MLVEGQGKEMAVEWETNVAKKKANLTLSKETQSAAGSWLQVQNSHFVVSDRSKGNFAEMTKDDKTIRQFSFGKPLDSVMKLTLGGMCFFGM